MFFSASEYNEMMNQTQTASQNVSTAIKHNIFLFLLRKCRGMTFIYVYAHTHTHVYVCKEMVFFSSKQIKQLGVVVYTCNLSTWG